MGDICASRRGLSAEGGSLGSEIKGQAKVPKRKFISDIEGYRCFLQGSKFVMGDRLARVD